MTLPYTLPWWGWAIAIIASLWIGISKTGIAGLGILGYQIIKRINQRVFEQLALILTAIAALRLLIG